MAQFRGKGSLSGVNLIVSVNDKRRSNKSMYITVQKDQSLLRPSDVKSGKKEADTNPYLNSTRTQHPDAPQGDTYIDHGMRYQDSQVERIIEAAGDNMFEDKNGVKHYGVNADLFINKNNDIIINTAKEMGPTTNKKFGPKTLTSQQSVTKAARAFRDAQRAAAKEAEAPAPEVEAEVQGSMETDGPDV